MSRRNRSALAALALGAALVLPIAAPATAAGHAPGRIPALGTLERAWNWLAGLLLPETVSTSLRQAVRLEKEGGAIDPDGRTSPSSPPPSTTTSQTSGGPALDGTQ
jgi:hypothetical protein